MHRQLRHRKFLAGGGRCATGSQRSLRSEFPVVLGKCLQGVKRLVGGWGHLNGPFNIFLQLEAESQPLSLKSWRSLATQGKVVRDSVCPDCSVTMNAGPRSRTIEPLGPTWCQMGPILKSTKTNVTLHSKRQALGTCCPQGGCRQ